MDNSTAGLIEVIVNSCTKCGQCLEHCVFLNDFDIDPVELCQNALADTDSIDSELIGSCNLCGVCAEVCPEGIDLGKLFLLLRQDRIQRDSTPSQALQWVRERQAWVNSGGFFYARGHERGNKCKSVFFPGCTLAGYNPDLVVQTYSYLKTQHDPLTGIILNCCGVPCEVLGAETDLKESLRIIRSQMGFLGASEIITACPNCYRILRERLPQHNVVTVYEIMERAGLPDHESGSGERMFLFHACATRNDEHIQAAVRSLIEKMGYEVVEDDGEGAKKCCGYGGMVGLTNPALASIIGAERTENVFHDIVTYCASCREALAHYCPSVHVLDLAFSPDWRALKNEPPREDGELRERASRLKDQLEKAQEEIAG